MLIGAKNKSADRVIIVIVCLLLIGVVITYSIIESTGYCVLHKRGFASRQVILGIFGVTTYRAFYCGRIKR